MPDAGAQRLGAQDPARIAVAVSSGMNTSVVPPIAFSRRSVFTSMLRALDLTSVSTGIGTMSAPSKS